ASVIGRTFARPVLESIWDGAADLAGPLETLVRAELIHSTHQEPEATYAFHHPLTREAAYGSMLRRRRRGIHRRVGEAVGRLFPERTAEPAAVLGPHFDAAGDVRAESYLKTAGDTAERLYAHDEAVEHYTRAILWARRRLAGIERPAAGDTALLYLFSRRGRALELSDNHEAALASYVEMEAVAGALGDRPLRLAALIACAGLRSTFTPLHDADAARDLLDRALALAGELGDRQAEAKLLWNLMMLGYSVREDERAVRFGEQ